MSFQNTAPCFLICYSSDQSLLLFLNSKFLFQILVCLLYITLSTVVGTIIHGYNTVELLYLW